MRSGFFAGLVAIGAALIVAWTALALWSTSGPSYGGSGAFGVLGLFVIPPALLLVGVGIPYGIARLPPAGTRGRRRKIVIFVVGGVIAVLLIGWFTYLAK
ncbi:MAG TPA: hypothetical protein VN677_09060 [Gemmatimonadaceae bacterium]|jgi:hypothetical protein|nr:hypothetical protein [Gemmatimonadaceae bacterium]